ncbi:hypothetical protein BW42_01525 [Exiguobacterium sp. RIT341]|nr:hypothetical protein BW42_01525 [Exiguobacterium sp. RIT341]KQS44788.1 hypothetical protein ASG02_01775 [Exiguobacterium sp. Leaf196]
MGGVNQYRVTSEWPSELQTESFKWVVGSDGFLPLLGSTNQDNGPVRFKGDDVSIVNEGGTAGLPVLHVLHEWARRPFSYTIESNKS